MRHTRLISAAVGALFLAATVTGCSEAKDAASKAADEAKAKASEAAASAAAEAGEKASGAAASAMAEATAKAGEILSQLGADTQAKLQEKIDAAGITVDSGEFADEPTANVAEQFFAARQAALVDGDASIATQLATPAYQKKVQRYVAKRQGKAKPFTITVVNAQGETVDLCVGPKGTKPKTVTLEGGLVAKVTKGAHTCA